MKERILFTSESVSEGHPDKVCDQISDAILDECFKQDPNSRVACECFATTNLVVIGGEITTNAKVDYEAVARNVLKEIGYDDEAKGMDYRTCKVEVVMDSQSSDIALGTNEEVGGAGDQGIMFGYATKETEGYMPLAISIAHHLVRYASTLRHDGTFKWARPDMKAQVTIDYTDEKPVIDTILMSIQHDDDFDEAEFKKFVKENIMDAVVKKYDMNTDYRVLINPTGRFVIGGPHGDTGLTGRKIIVDTYGGYARHGGGAFSGKDPTKVPLYDKETMSIFSSTDALGVTKEQIHSEVGSFGVPEFGTKFVRGMLVDTKPKTFDELIRISRIITWYRCMAWKCTKLNRSRNSNITRFNMLS